MRRKVTKEKLDELAKNKEEEEDDEDTNCEIKTDAKCGKSA